MTLLCVSAVKDGTVVVCMLGNMSLLCVSVVKNSTVVWVYCEKLYCCVCLFLWNLVLLHVLIVKIQLLCVSVVKDSMVTWCNFGVISAFLFMNIGVMMIGVFLALYTAMVFIVRCPFRLLIYKHNCLHAWCNVYISVYTNIVFSVFFIYFLVNIAHRQK